MEHDEELARIHRHRRRKGPWDLAEAVGRLGDPGDLGIVGGQGEEPGDLVRIDLGALLLLVPEEAEVWCESAAGQPPTSAFVGLHGSVLRLSAWVARVRCSRGWDDIRMSLLDNYRWADHPAGMAKGPHGDEVIAAAVADEAPPRRYLGCDGPGWVLQGEISGVAALDREWAADFERVFRETIVVGPAEGELACCAPIPLGLPDVGRDR